MTKFKAAMQRFRANAPRFNHAAMDDDLERVLKRESATCACGKPVAVLHSGAPCKYCKGCLAKNMVGAVDALPL
jgi:hypothetical protein